MFIRFAFYEMHKMQQPKPEIKLKMQLICKDKSGRVVALGVAAGCWLLARWQQPLQLAVALVVSTVCVHWQKLNKGVLKQTHKVEQCRH